MPDEDVKIYVPGTTQQAPEPEEESEYVRIYPSA